MKYISLILTTLGVMFGFVAQAQTKTLPLNDGANLKIYRLEPTSKAGQTTSAKVAVSYNKGNEDPIFGMVWIQANAIQNGQQIQLQDLKITDLKIPQLDDVTEAAVKSQLTANADKLNFTMEKNQFDNALQLYQKESDLAKGIKNTVPKIIYAKKPSILVLIDGQPKYKINEDLGVNLVTNSPFVIVQNTDGKHYIYGGKNWYVGNTLKGNYTITTNLPAKISQVESSLKQMQAENDNQEFEEFNENIIYDILVSTEPAELIQSNGEANFSPVTGTNLLYVDNSDDDIFMDINSQQYYTLLAGRWFTSNSLTGTWKYISSETLPKDFAQIIEGSSKDNVLASVAGTEAAREAVLDAQIPQTAKVQRSSSTTIQYDGNPSFESIEGTNLQYAINTPTSVIKYQGRYYAVEDGIWYVANNANGPWAVATERPDEVVNIPASSPVYNIKYVHVYDVTPEYVYMGYTPGYLNTFIYGPTVVYGTGYYYRPWIGNYYYGRPYTWGFGIRYNPWYGFGFGFNYYSGWFYNPWRYHSYAWWGPRLYRPAYVYRPYYRGQMVRSGFYTNRYYNNYRTQIHSGIRNNNIYNGRRDVVTRDRGRIATASSNYDRLTRAPRIVERNNMARNQNPNIERRGMDRGDRNNSVRREGMANNGIDRSYRNDNRSGNVGRPSTGGTINNRGNVTQNRNNGINRDYRSGSANGDRVRSADRSANAGTNNRGDRSIQNPNTSSRPQIAENRTPRPNYDLGRPQGNNRNERVNPNVNRSGRSAEPGVRNENSTPQRNSGTISRPNSSNSNRGGANVERGNSAPARSGGTINRGSSAPARSGGTINRGSSAPARSGGTINRGSSAPARSTPSVNRGGGGSSSRSSGTPARSSGGERGRP